MISGVIFDVDGVLLDSMPIWDKAGEMYLNSLGIKANPGLGEILFPMSMQNGAVYLKETYHLEESIPAIMDGINQTVKHFYREEAPLKDGVKDFLTELKRNRIRITVATSSDRPIIEAAFQRLDIMQYVERIFTCTELITDKRKPDIYLAAQNFMKTSLNDTWVFEDAVHAARTAHEAGFKIVGIYDEASKMQQRELKEISDIYMEKLCNIKDFIELVTIIK